MFKQRLKESTNVSLKWKNAHQYSASESTELQYLSFVAYIMTFA